MERLAEVAPRSLRLPVREALTSSSLSLASFATRARSRAAPHPGSQYMRRVAVSAPRGALQWPSCGTLMSRRRAVHGPPIGNQPTANWESKAG
jgi:hypothetical protein